jgi:hypothetical protein
LDSGLTACKKKERKKERKRKLTPNRDNQAPAAAAASPKSVVHLWMRFVMMLLLEFRAQTKAEKRRQL